MVGDFFAHRMHLAMQHSQFSVRREHSFENVIAQTSETSIFSLFDTIIRH
jgi:hypothetical protein